MGQGVTFGEAELTFLCKETVSAPVLTGRLSTGNPRILCGETRSLSDFKGGWQPHYVFVGEIIDVRKKEENHVE